MSIGQRCFSLIESLVASGGNTSTISNYLLDETVPKEPEKKLESEISLELAELCRHGSSGNTDMPKCLLSDAIASALLITPSIKVRKASVSTLRTLFCIGQNSTSLAAGKWISDNEMGEINILDILVGLLPLADSRSLCKPVMFAGKNYNEPISEGKAPTCCTDLFDLLEDLLEQVWQEAAESQRQTLLHNFVSCLENSSFGSTPEENPTASNLSHGCDTCLARPVPSCKGIKDVPALLSWIFSAIRLVPNREFRRAESSVAEAEKLPQLRPRQQSLKLGPPAGQKYAVDWYLVGLMRLGTNILTLADNDRVKAAAGQTLLCTLFERFGFHFPKGKRDGISCADRFSLSAEESMVSSGHCPSPATSEAARKMLLCMCCDCPKNIEALAQLLLDQHYNFDDAHPPRRDLMGEWNIDPIAKRKSGTGFVGMKNLVSSPIIISPYYFLFSSTFIYLQDVNLCSF